MITDSLMKWAGQTPDKAFVVTDDGSYSYSEMASLSLRFGGRLSKLGIVRGDHVAIIADNSAAYLVAWFGICLVGAVAVGNDGAGRPGVGGGIVEGRLGIGADHQHAPVRKEQRGP